MKKVSIKNIKKKKKGFTLVELIIVIAIIAILAAMAIPKFSAVRLDAKVSNDVAAAKNISTITATLIANGTIKPAAALTTITVSDATGTATEIQARLDGKAKSGKTEALAGSDFKVTVDQKENIIVYAGTHQIYPDDDGAFKTAYITEAKK